MGKHDTTDSQLAFRFLEARPLEATLGGMVRYTKLKNEQEPVRNKWLYTFWSEGEHYAVNEGNGSWDARVNFRTYAGQSMGKLGKHFQAPVPTTAPRETAHHPGLEIWFHGDGRMSWTSLEGKVDAPRHQRPDPRKSRRRAHELPIALMDPGRDQRRRWYFILSSVRLGPAALEACMRTGHGDGLSIKVVDQAGGRARALTWDDIEARDRDTATSEEKRWLRRAMTITVADPYHMAGRINASVLMPSLDAYVEIMERLGDGRSLPQIADEFIANDEYKGTITDLYIIAKTLKAYGKETPLPVDKGKIDDVINFMDGVLRGSRHYVEARAAFLVHWLMGTGHRIIDLAISEDTPSAGGKTVREESAADRAYGLAHWYNVTSFLGFTGAGAAFMSAMNREIPENPVLRHLLRYWNAGRDLTNGSVDQMAFAQVKDIIPDLALRSFVELSGSNERVISRRVHRVADLMNTLRFFEEDITLKPPSKDPAKGYTRVKPYVDKGIFAWSTAAESSDLKILKDLATDKPNPLVVKLMTWADENAPSFGKRLARMDNAGSKIPTGALGPAKAFAAIVNLMTGAADKANKISDNNTTTRQKLENGVDLALDTTTVVDEICGIMKIEKASLQVYTAARGKGATRLAALAQKGAGAGMVLSLCGVVSAAWTVYGNGKKLYHAVVAGDLSVAAGAGIAVLGGILLFLTSAEALTGFAFLSFASGGTVAFVAAILILIGGTIVWLTADDFFEKFAMHCWFSTKTARRNTFIPDGDDDKPVERWLGPQPPEGEPWPVAHQRAALMNVHGRFTAHSNFDGHLLDKDWHDFEMQKASLDLTWRVLPGVAWMTVELETTIGGNRVPISVVEFKVTDRQAVRQKTTIDRVKATSGMSHTNRGREHVLHLRYHGPETCGKDLVARVKLAHPTGILVHEHRLAYTYGKAKGGMITAPTTEFALNWDNKKVSGPSNDFHVKKSGFPRSGPRWALAY